jgi:hypothetical protein
VTCRAVALLALLVASGLACIDGNIPPRPSATTPDPDAGDTTDAPDGGADESGVDGGPVLLAKSSSCTGMKLVVSDGRLFWTDERAGTVNSVSTSGGQPTTIASLEVAAGAIAVDPKTKSVFWAAAAKIDPDDGMVIRKASVAGGTPSTFWPAPILPKNFGDENHINALFVSNGILYFGRYIYAEKIPTDGQIPMVIGLSPDGDFGRPGAFAIDATELYQVEILHNAVTREKLDGTQNGLLEDGMNRSMYAPDRIASSQSGLLTDTIGMIDDHVLWAVGPEIYRKAGNATDLNPRILVASTAEGDDVTGFVVSGGSVYFGEGGADNVEVSTVYDGNGVVRVIATGQMSPSQFAADDQNIYWRTLDCKIMKLAK